MRRLAVVLTILLVAGACATPDQPASLPAADQPGVVDGNPEDPVQNEPGDPAPPPNDGSTVADPDDPNLRAELFKPTGNTIDPKPITWVNLMVADDDVTVTIFWWSGVEPCYVLDRVEVVATEDAIAIGLFQGAADGEPVACIELAQYKATEVLLSEPVAGRPIVDAHA